MTRFGWRGAPAVFFIAFSAAISSATPAATSDTRAACACYALTAWTVKEGLPGGNVLSIAQDREGYLWLGTNSGLVRFDGFQFVQWGGGGDAALPGTFIPALVGARDGSVWVGFEDVSGVTRIRDGKVTNYGAQDGLPPGGVAALIEDRHGTLWAGGHGGLAVFRGTNWERLGKDAGLPELDVFSLYEDRQGTLWTGTSAGVFRRADGDRSFELIDLQLRFVQSFAEDRWGVLWVTDADTFVQALSPARRPRIDPAIHRPGAGSRLLRDQYGSIWVAALGAGLFHLQQPRSDAQPQLERYAYEHKFSGAARSVFEDRDKNLWVGMRGGGLLRLSQSPVKTDFVLDGLTNDGVHALATAVDGSLWVATGHDLNVFSRNGRKTFSAEVSLLHGDRHGDMWAVTATGIGRFQNGHFVHVQIPAVVRVGRSLSLATDARQRLWLCIYDQGLFRWGVGELTRFEDVPNVAGRSCNSVYQDSRDRIWVGFTAGGLAVYEHNAFTVYEPRDGLAPGAIAAIYEDHAGSIWISTVTGITRIANGKLTTVVGHGLPSKLVPSLVEDAEGFLWLGVNSGAALIRLDPREVDQAAVDPHHQIIYRRYDESDGLEGPLLRLSRPTAARGSDGRLWFVSGAGIAAIDPHELQSSRSSASPHLERVTIDGKETEPLADLKLPPRTLTLQIDYGALSLSSASKLRFRYMLEGLTPEWVEAGGRRQVSYTNLQPGGYRFQLQAASDAAWTKSVTWQFTVLPPFYRTYWFYGLSAAGVAFVFWASWWLRMRSVRNEFALIIAERTRVSRDIHDTLLQSLGAFTLQLEVVARQLDPSQRSARDELQHLRRQVKQCIKEARRSVWALRSPRLEAQDLVEAFQQMANDAMIAAPAKIRVTAIGRSRRCAPHVEEQLLRIGQEAISNAVHHGEAVRVDITLEYSGSTVSLSVADNGRGFVEDPAKASTGHWGLENMRGRAAELGGRVTITSSPGNGTVIRAIVPL
jgi:signal transduction histidine kinase/ligand-binding sensor domain-containing protein